MGYLMYTANPFSLRVFAKFLFNTIYIYRERQTDRRLSDRQTEIEKQSNPKRRINQCKRKSTL